MSLFKAILTPESSNEQRRVQMVMQEYTYFEIRDVLQVSCGFISKWLRIFEEQGITGLVLKHQGSRGYLDAEQRLGVIDWLKQKNYWNLEELQQHIQDTKAVVFASKQSYYDLFQEAGISWKKTHKRNPKKDPQLVEKKTGDYSHVRGTSTGDCCW
ncbi:MAG TPA: winged helix-turn-helix domain-containing protein [Leptolyngbyaceae cyanobacterium]